MVEVHRVSPLAYMASNTFQYPHLYIAEASAGSGKTYALAKRYVSLLVNPPFNSAETTLAGILAITFTNKAAIEMKARILDFIKRIALDAFPSCEEKEAFLSALQIQEEPARQKAFNSMDAILKNYNYFQVQTIDSFINAILSGCAFKLNLSSSFKTRRNSRDYLAYSLDLLIDQAAQDHRTAQVFKDFLRQYLFLQNKTSWFPKADIENLVASLFAEYNKYSGVFVRSRLDTQDILALKKDSITCARRLRGLLPEGAHKGFVKSLDTFLERNKESFDVDDLPAYLAREAVPLTGGRVPAREVSLAWDSLKEKLQKLCEAEAACLYNPYIDIFNLVLADLAKITSREDVMFLEALNKQARLLFLEKGLSLPELYSRLACRFKHFLIDEFQDTSLLQWDNIFPMVEDALAQEGSLFYVGDRKQAIYRFRAGDASLFTLVPELFSKTPCIREKLAINYRSQKEIVDFNNMLFSPANLRRFLTCDEVVKKGGADFHGFDMEEIVAIFKDSAQQPRASKSAGYVEVELLECKDKDEKERLLKEKVVSRIRQITPRYAPQDIAVLVRRNDEVEMVSSWLLEAGFAVESEKTLDIRQHAYVKELVSFLKFLHSPIDNLSFASFILGDIFCQAAGIDPAQIQHFIFRVARQKGSPAYLYRAFRIEYPGIWQGCIEEFFKSVGFVPLYELVISILGKFEVMQRFGQYQGYFMRFLELIRQQEEEHAGIASFLEYFEAAEKEEMYVHVKDSHAIKILTIHKAKGLEFPVTVVPFLEINIKAGPDIVIAHEAQLKLVHYKKNYAAYSAALAALGADEYLKGFIDELDNAYVALTRASDEMHLFVPSKSQRGANFAFWLFPEGSCVRGTWGRAQVALAEKQPPTVGIPVSVYKDWVGLLQDECASVNLLRFRTQLAQGEMMHLLLGSIGNLHGQEESRLIRHALARGARAYPGALDAASLEPRLRALLAQEALRPYFEVPDGQVFVEQEVVDINGATRRIDRLILKADEAIIIDYKSSREASAEYTAQVQEYMRIIGGMYPARKVRGVLLYLDELCAEEVG